MNTNAVPVIKTTKFGVFDVTAAATIQVVNSNGNVAVTTTEASSSKPSTKETKPPSSKESKATTATATTATPQPPPVVKEKAAAPAPKSFARRDHLRNNEIRIQAQWDANKEFDSHFDATKPKFFLNFPYPYMNGRLHLGHAFSLTKAEFTARFQRLQGKNVLFPFAFHCTGMPIQAAANKLRDEIAKFGNPPVFPSIAEDATTTAAADEPTSTSTSTSTSTPAEESKMSAEATIAAKSKGKKSKLIVKGQAGPMRQWDILAKMVPKDEIASFADPLKWLNYFPPYGASDLKAFGSAIDWRRSFITTSVNPYYDAFIRWQYNRLKEGGRIKFGKRANVFSILDGQVCADHDRSSGEGVGPQEYTIIKLLVLQPYPANSPLNSPVLAGKNVYLAPATLRPETMYGQVGRQIVYISHFSRFFSSLLFSSLLLYYHHLFFHLYL
jgi:leucyl-tRNA synthetase